MQMGIQPEAFLGVVRPALEAGNARDLVAQVGEHWEPDEVAQLLTSSDLEARQAAALVIGLIGDRSDVERLAKCLRDPDEGVAQMAEHGLWSLWFRCSEPEAGHPFCHGLSALEAEDYPQAIELFNEAAEIDPNFAETHNQMGIAWYFLEDWEKSAHACCKAIKLMPVHFGAMAGAGHCYAQMGDLKMALRCYRRAVRIHPRLAGIPETIAQLETNLDDVRDEQGVFDPSRIGSSRK